jgi:hypothetical protein
MHKVVVDATTGTSVETPLSAEDQAQIAADSQAYLDALPGLMIQAIKAEAGRRIEALCPDWKQRNLTARAAELALAGTANLTDAEVAEIAAGQAVWDAIKAIRAASDQLEAGISAMDTTALAAFRPGDDSHWTA